MVFQALPPGFRVNLQALLDLGLSRVAAGHPVTGRILADEGGGKVTVLLGGRQLSLNLGQASFSVGQTFTAQVVEGRLVVSFGSHQTSLPVESLTGEPATRPLEAILANLGAPTSETARSVATSLLAAQIPLSRELIAALTEVLPQVLPEDVPLLAFLLSRGIPVSVETFSLARRLLGHRGRVGEALTGLERGLESLERKLDALEDRVVAIQYRQGLADRRRRLNRYFLEWMADDSPEEKGRFAKELKELVRDMSVSAEGVRLLGLNGAHLATELWELYRYLSALRGHEIPGLEGLISSLLAGVNDLYENLAGQSLGHLRPEDPEQPALFFFQVPVVIEGRPRTLELLYRPHSGRPKDGGTLTLRLELPHLGPIKIMLDYRAEMLSVTLTVTTAPLKQAIQPELEALRETLAGAGISVASVRVVHGVVPSTLREEILEVPAGVLPARGFDARA